LGASITDLSVADNCFIRTAMEPVLPNTPVRGWSILTTIEKFIQQNGPSVGDTETVYALSVPQSLVNIAHIGKVE